MPKLPKISPPLAPQFFKVTDPDEAAPYYVNLSWVRSIEAGRVTGFRGLVPFLVLSKDSRFAVTHPREIAALAAILKTTPKDLTGEK